MTTLFTTDADGFREATLEEIMAGARAALNRKMRKGTLMDSPKATADYLMTRLAERDFETFTILHLDNRHRLIACQELFRGTIDGASVHPREVVKECLRHGSAAVLLAHNHPSGVAEPSQADEMITARLKAALALVEIRVLDHCIIGGATFVSFAQRGLI